jgi:hypothetical protein
MASSSNDWCYKLTIDGERYAARLGPEDVAQVRAAHIAGLRIWTITKGEHDELARATLTRLVGAEMTLAHLRRWHQG